MLNRLKPAWNKENSLLLLTKGWVLLTFLILNPLKALTGIGFNVYLF